MTSSFLPLGSGARGGAGCRPRPRGGGGGGTKEAGKDSWLAVCASSKCCDMASAISPPATETSSQGRGVGVGVGGVGDSIIPEGGLAAGCKAGNVHQTASRGSPGPAQKWGREPSKQQPQTPKGRPIPVPPKEGSSPRLKKNERAKSGVSLQPGPKAGSSDNGNSKKPPPSSSGSLSTPQASASLATFRVYEQDLLCSPDEVKVFSDEGEDGIGGVGGVDLEGAAGSSRIIEELEAELLEEKAALIRETELGIKQELISSRLEPGGSNYLTRKMNCRRMRSCAAVECLAFNYSEAYI